MTLTEELTESVAIVVENKRLRTELALANATIKVLEVRLQKLETRWPISDLRSG